ncbi:MAG: sterol desaturase, partial [Bacteroidota bacterium]
MDQISTAQLWLLITSVQLLRYGLTAGIAFGLFYGVLRRKKLYAKIQQRFPKDSDYRREILYSIATAMIFGVIGILVFHSPIRAYTQIYTDIDAFGWGYFFLSIFLMIM